MSDLPPEVIGDILFRLPVKSLLRFRCVCKPWRSLIDSRDFITQHLHHSNESTSHLILSTRGCELFTVDLDMLGDVTKLHHPLSQENGADLVGSCNGLLAFVYSYGYHALWNPWTRKFQKLPFTRIKLRSNRQFVVYGFGYDSINDDYKLIKVFQFYGYDESFLESEAKVYSLKSNSWRKIEDFPSSICYGRAYGVLVHNALHWLVSSMPNTSYVIVAFDLGTEEYCEMPQPEYGGENFRLNVGVLGGCLCISCNYRTHVDVWVMKEYGVKESWVKQFSVIEPGMVNNFNYLRPLAYTKYRDKVFLEQDGEKLVCYDLLSKRATNVRIHGVPYFIETQLCAESFVALNGGSVTRGKKKRSIEDQNKISQKRLSLETGH